ncbi:metallophosphoesterase family protein [Lentilactobacillus sunkii]|uniref:Metallophosphoesterase n=1 Tax=Lentilactobacillus sunkii DSM 19904 TaxID=1423808 RepID=A0A0R1LDZ9_9LACO|nr:DNA repair exonuclease [Lentilactobacillus sunkii]KRK89927.1 metallophosphoesterase [Lentilactobacillus sunkii DSM 19904]
MKFIHTADLHLDSPFLGLKNNVLPDELWERVHQSTFDSFEKIIDAAIEQKVDFVLLVGDLFDREERSVAADAFLTDQLQRLDNNGIEAFVSFGNHDYSTSSPDSFGYPDNTMVFGNQVETKKYTLSNGEVVAVSGFSFDKQWITQPMIQNYPQAVSDATWNIGMLHGSLSTLNAPEANYAPFTLTELEDKGYDYWALGHIHKRQALNDQGTINYSGNTQGRHINESGEKGYILVQSDGHQLKSEFKPTAPIIWDRVPISLADLASDQLAESILETIADLHYAKLHFIRVQLTSDSSIDSDVLAAINNGSLLDDLQQINADKWQQLNCWITSIEAPKTSNLVYSSIDQKYFNQAKAETLTDDVFDQIVKGFNKQPAFIKDEVSTDESKHAIFDQAGQILRENVVNPDDVEDDSK